MTSETPAEHSVAQLLFARRDQGSKPGKRLDGRRLALIVEGGAMRGVVSAGMVAALETLGLRDSFDMVFGSSAGSISGAYFIAGQARYGTTIFYENINNKQFVDLKRLFGKSPIVSLEFLLDEVCVNQKPLMYERVINSDIPLYIVAASIKKKRSVAISDFSNQSELLDALRASARIPFFAGDPVALRDDFFLDASVYESIPFKTAIDVGAPTDLVVLMTRPAGDLRTNPNWIDRRLVAPYLARIDPELGTHYLQRAESYRSEMDLIHKYAGQTSEPRMLPVQIPLGTSKVSPLETSREKLVRGGIDGFGAVYTALGLPIPQLVEIITPFQGNQA
jgi:predicted patatin/cPLA2 family phospholipase